jgi:hypothetical protein
MLFYAARNRRRARRARMQLYLGFLDIPVPEACVWGQLSDERRKAVIQMLARLMTKAASASRTVDGKENEDDRQQRQD